MCFLIFGELSSLIKKTVRLLAVYAVTYSDVTFILIMKLTQNPSET